LRKLGNYTTATPTFFNTIGASWPFPWVLANVSSPNPQRPFAISGDETGAIIPTGVCRS